MRFEICNCQRCGYEYTMPDISYLGKDWGTFDVASWAYCTPACLMADCGERGDLSWGERLYRPIFRYLEFRKWVKHFKEVKV